MNKNEKNCPCYSGKTYDACCHPFHQGCIPENALLLMRSRYSAYALNLPDYIIDTTHQANPHYSKNTVAWKKHLSEFALKTSFLDLKIHDFKEKGNLATVTFTAYLAQEGRDATLTERSDFEKVNHQWLYRKGQQINFPFIS